jgi:hypothetical protein
MAIIGREPASQAITSADIVDGAFTLNDLNFTDVPANLNITGTIDKNTMRLAEGVTVIGDVTISDDLVLAKLSDDGVGITMTTDGTTRTITGSGSIESTTIAQTHSPSLTGMTGTLPAGTVMGYQFQRTANVAAQNSVITWTTVAGSSLSYTPTPGATWVKYNCRVLHGAVDARSITGVRVYHDGALLDYSRLTLDTNGGSTESDGFSGWSNFDTMIPAWSGAKTTLLQFREHSAAFTCELHKVSYHNDADTDNMTAAIFTPTEVTMYSIM